MSDNSTSTPLSDEAYIAAVTACMQKLDYLLERGQRENGVQVVWRFDDLVLRPNIREFRLQDGKVIRADEAVVPLIPRFKIEGTLS